MTQPKKIQKKLTPLMPRATAIWLIDKTSLTFQQIADFCGIHVLEVKAIADEEVVLRMRPRDPIAAGETTWDDVHACEKDAAASLEVMESEALKKLLTAQKGARYTPLFKRQKKPNAVLWLLRNHEELSDAQIVRLVGTTRPTIENIRSRTHWNAANLTPLDPVALGLCTQSTLNEALATALKRQKKEGLPKADVSVENEETQTKQPQADADEFSTISSSSSQEDNS